MGVVEIMPSIHSSPERLVWMNAVIVSSLGGQCLYSKCVVLFKGNDVTSGHTNREQQKQGYVRGLYGSLPLGYVITRSRLGICAILVCSGKVADHNCIGNVFGTTNQVVGQFCIAGVQVVFITPRVHFIQRCTLRKVVPYFAMYGTQFPTSAFGFSCIPIAGI